MAGMKRLIFIAALLIVGFAVSCGVTLIFTSPPQPQPEGETAGTVTTLPNDSVLNSMPALGMAGQIRPGEKQLAALIQSLRSKLAESRQMKDRLERREKRVRMAEQLLKKDAQDLEDLRVKLVGPLSRLKEAKADLVRTIAQIEPLEAVNLKKMAKVFDKMDSASSSRILSEKCSSGKEIDAAKILYYMSDRSAAKALAEMTAKGLAAGLTERLKRMKAPRG
ncbi:hypothetical protein LCGC14_2003490 [marine sediment metagenome]|uniref:Magnesium transporter MgtE intracellular domain-containing protein n=1 Tax=marine sediment metagenome TaxID=412755 RepID=A0A0F9FQ76_9ZZZZ